MLFSRAGVSRGPQQAAGATYYVGPRGDDSGPGSQARPWRTVERVNRQQLYAGDAVLFEGGQNFEGNLVLDERVKAGSSRSVVIGSYGNGRAVIDGGRGTAILVRNIGRVTLRDLEVRGGGPESNRGYGVEVVNERGIRRLESIWLDNIEASGFHWAGIYVGGVPGVPGGAKPPEGIRYGFRDVRIARCTSHGNMYYGIWVSGPWPAWMGKTTGYANQAVRITHSLAFDNAGDPGYKQNHSGNGILLDDTDGGLIDHCTAWHNGAANGSLQGGPVGIWADESNAVTIQFCESYNNRTGGAADGGGFDLDGGVTHSLLQYNYSHGNDGAGFLVWSYWGAVHPLAHNVIRYNVSENDGRKHRYGGIHIGTSGGAVGDIKVYNNTVFMSPAAGGGSARHVAAESKNAPQPRVIWVGGSERDLQIRFWNNLLIAGGGVPLVEIEPHQDVTFQGNAYWAAAGKFVFLDGGAVYGGLDEWRSAAGRERLRREATGLAVDPKVTSMNGGQTISGKRPLSDLRAYRLLPESPLIDAALDLARDFGVNAGAQDFWGTRIPQGAGFDVGACEAPGGRR
jgi:Right handed beta helix region